MDEKTAVQSTEDAAIEDHIDAAIEDAARKMCVAHGLNPDGVKFQDPDGSATMWWETFQSEASQHAEAFKVFHAAARRAEASVARLGGEEPETARPLTPAEIDVMRERDRQIMEKGYRAWRDDGWMHGELANAAALYAFHAKSDSDHLVGRSLAENGHKPHAWPWAPEFWRPESRRADLVKAAALIVAEIERLDRAEARAQGEKERAAAEADRRVVASEETGELPRAGIGKSPVPEVAKGEPEPGPGHSPARSEDEYMMRLHDRMTGGDSADAPAGEEPKPQGGMAVGRDDVVPVEQDPDGNGPNAA